MSAAIEAIREAVLKRFRGAIDRGEVDSLVLFGSFARGDNGPDSDVDVLVIGEISERELYEALADVDWELRGRLSFSTVSFLHLRPEEAGKFRSIYLFMYYHSVTLYDRRGTFARVLDMTRGLLAESGARLVRATSRGRPFYYLVFERVNGTLMGLLREEAERELEAALKYLSYSNPDYACALFCRKSLEALVHNYLRLAGVEAPLKHAFRAAELERDRLSALVRANEYLGALEEIEGSIAKSDYSNCDRIRRYLRKEIEGLMRTLALKAGLR